jgi:protein phosphatase
MIPVKRAHLAVKAVSHAGSSGKNNEDRFGISAYTLEDAQRTPSVLAVIADGIGGHRAGEVAAELAIETISRSVAQSDGSQPVDILEAAVIRAGQAIFQASQQDMSWQGMGSTCACAWVIGDRLYIASVGDSRIYLVRSDHIQQVTVDHTWIQEAVDQGALTPEQARRHPNAHVIRRFLGSRQDVVPDMRLCSSANGICSEANQGEVLLPGDVLIICSDGLTDLVSDDEILAAVRQFPAERALEELVKSANQRGGHDNITILYLGMPATKEEAAEAVQPRSRLRILPACLAAAAVVGLCAFLAAGLLWYRLRSEARLNLPNLAIPRIQVTLFPGTAENELPLAATPSVLPALTGTLAPPAETPEAPENPAPADLPAATLTPWPTNTPGPAP